MQRRVVALEQSILTRHRGDCIAATLSVLSFQKQNEILPNVTNRLVPAGTFARMSLAA